jgi:hypothetical protein
MCVYRYTNIRAYIHFYIHALKHTYIHADSYKGIVAAAAIKICQLCTDTTQTDKDGFFSGLTSSRGVVILTHAVNWMHTQMGLYPRTRCLRGLCLLHSDCSRVVDAAKTWSNVMQVCFCVYMYVFMCVCMVWL